MHDLGKLYTPREILNNPGRLTPEEFEIVKRHAADGAEMLDGVGDPEIAAMVRHHHERVDGRGYPDGLTGSQIPLGARIIAVADTFDAITSNRAYRGAGTQKLALKVIAAGAGTQLDAAAVAAFRQRYSGRRSVAWLALATAVCERAVIALQAASQTVVTGAGATSLLPALGAAGLFSLSPALGPHAAAVHRGAPVPVFGAPAAVRAHPAHHVAIRGTTRRVARGNTHAIGRIAPVRPISRRVAPRTRVNVAPPSTGGRAPGGASPPASAPGAPPRTPVPVPHVEVPPPQTPPSVPSVPPVSVPGVTVPSVPVPPVPIPVPGVPNAPVKAVVGGVQVTG